LVKLKTFLAMAFASALMKTVMAAPAFAFHHAFLPGELAAKARTPEATTPRRPPRL
jgi:hypothetical protein